MDERFALASAEENQKGLKAETDIFMFVCGSCFSTVTVLKSSKSNAVVNLEDFIGLGGFPVSSTGWNHYVDNSVCSAQESWEVSLSTVI